MCAYLNVREREELDAWEEKNAAASLISVAIFGPLLQPSRRVLPSQVLRIGPSFHRCQRHDAANRPGAPQYLLHQWICAFDLHWKRLAACSSRHPGRRRRDCRPQISATRSSQATKLGTLRADLSAGCRSQGAALGLPHAMTTAKGSWAHIWHSFLAWQATGGRASVKQESVCSLTATSYLKFMNP